MKTDNTFVGVPASALPFDTLADLKSAVARVAAFGIVGTVSRPLLAEEPTEREHARVERAMERWIEEGKEPAEFTDSAKTWDACVPEAFRAIVRDDVSRILATLLAMRNRSGACLAFSWNLSVNGFTVPVAKILEAVAGTKGAKLTPRAIVAACKG